MRDARGLDAVPVADRLEQRPSAAALHPREERRGVVLRRGIGPADLLYALDALLAAGLVRPVDPPRRTPGATRLNALIRAGAAAGKAPSAQVTCHGVSVPVSRADLLLLDAPASRRARVRCLLAHPQSASLAGEDQEAAAEHELSAHLRRRRLYRSLGIV